MLSLLFFFLSFHLGYTINVAGSTNFRTAWNRITASYQQIKSQTVFNYTAGTAPPSIAMLASGDVSASIIDLSLDTMIQYNPQNRTYFERFVNLPLFSQSFALIYNIPELTSNDLVLTWEVIADICLGNIKTWNDPALVALNPVLYNVSRNIINIQRKEPTVITLMFTDLLSKYSPEWKEKYGSGLFWPKALESNTTIIYTNANVFSSYAQVFATPYSFALGSYTFFYSIGFPPNVNFAGILDPVSGKINYPNDTKDVADAMERLDYNVNEYTKNLQLDASWEMTAMGYLILPVNSSRVKSCDEYTEALKFLRWCFNDSKVSDILKETGYTTPSQSMSKAIQSFLEQITCDNKVLLDVVTIREDLTGKTIITCIYWIFLLITSGFLFAIKNKKPVAIIYLIILIVGLILCGIAAILWTLEPSSDVICRARWWFMGLGMVVFSSGVFCRSYQLKKIHKLVKGGKYKSSKKINHIKLLVLIMGILTIVEVIILIILDISTPYKTAIDLMDVVDRKGVHNCVNSVPYIWMIILSLYLGFILAMGIYFMYSTWGISSSVDDTRINVFMIFLCLVSLGVSDVILTYSNQSNEAESWWALGLIFIWSFSMMCSIFVPKLVKSNKKSSSSNHTTTDISSTSTSQSVKHQSTL